ncbi:Malate dehydrogenase (oxaloacetate- decarboxylating) [Acidimicrobium ferrooxidans DSM 10331]|uniref:Malate dehydrogenase (Oxaloacetate-decarboxylating) n=1 Tax=Acidimicrobium ferrooxidans (strain DSM 10331 / JCM 15462 / NBRC 103882 / ICP) TaxID=525909 RepID=C7M1V4_ACIFD|nr:NAD-dependent malic enzyme [Acidimicrobium ferrooxidans]ACU54851.1 Malate dehydrogenase (oxaloacetate- decarboxylating) [Acidimicrobium ferrooxidans DSM 10331]
MATPNVSHSVTLRVELTNQPGTLGRLTTAIGEAGGNILGVDLVEVDAATIVRDITVLSGDPEHAERIREAAEGVPGVHVRSLVDRVFRLHAGGKIEVRGKTPIQNRDDLSMAYTPGVARVSLAIAQRPSLVHRYTIKSNSVAVVTDGTAVLGLGAIGPHASLPVMEGKAQLFKEFAGIDAFPVPITAPTTEALIEAIAALEPAFGGINLEDIAAPRCFEVEAALTSRLDIPVFHDDQHGTAVVVLAALRNACRVVDKKLEELTVVIAGAGAAGVATAKILDHAGVGRIIVADRRGAIFSGREEFTGEKAWLAEHTNPERRMGSVGEALAGADVFIGVSGPGVITAEDVRTMGTNPIVFALANPDPEVSPESLEGIAAVVATGRSDYPNQINNVLCFPGIFRGALDAHAMVITEGMKLVAAEAIAAQVTDDELSPSTIIPSVFNRSVAPAVAEAVMREAIREGVVRHAIDD